MRRPYPVLALIVLLATFWYPVMFISLFVWWVGPRQRDQVVELQWYLWFVFAGVIYLYYYLWRGYFRRLGEYKAFKRKEQVEKTAKLAAEMYGAGIWPPPPT